MENVINNISYSLNAYPTHLTMSIIVLQAFSILLFILYIIRCYIKDNIHEKVGVIILILLFALANTYLFSVTANDTCAFECSLNNTTIRVDYQFYCKVKHSGVTSINVDNNIELTEYVVRDLVKAACNFE